MWNSYRTLYNTMVNAIVDGSTEGQLQLETTLLSSLIVLSSVKSSENMSRVSLVTLYKIQVCFSMRADKGLKLLGSQGLTTDACLPPQTAVPGVRQGMRMG